MNRRQFVLSGIAAPAGAMAIADSTASRDSLPLREQFLGTDQRVYLNAAGMMPLGRFSQQGLEAYFGYQRIDRDPKQSEYVRQMWRQLRGSFAQLVGASEDEIGLVHCTKAGEQIALDAVDSIKSGGNIVTNDLHFTGSLHNLIGLRSAGRDVRIVRARDWTIDLDQMAEAIDDRTALVTVSLVSNINGHQEDIRALSELTHRKGALLFADIIQAAGIVPLNLPEMGVDLASCSCYKWLYGTYGTGFLFIRKEHQGQRIPDRMFPGSARHNYSPWVHPPDPDLDEFRYTPPDDATRFQPGHPSYLGYCAAYEGLRFLHRVGVENARAHSVALNRRLLRGLDPDRFRCITPQPEQSPICTLVTTDPDSVRERLAAARVDVSHSGNRIRISPALYNNEADIDTLKDALMG